MAGQAKQTYDNVAKREDSEMKSLKQSSGQQSLKEFHYSGSFGLPPQPFQNKSNCNLPMLD